jgi:hypothetical protein
LRIGVDPELASASHGCLARLMVRKGTLWILSSYWSIASAHLQSKNWSKRAFHWMNHSAGIVRLEQCRHQSEEGTTTILLLIS